MAVQNNIHAKLPIIEVIFFILISLSKHGYAIVTEVEALSGSQVVLSKRP